MRRIGSTPRERGSMSGDSCPDVLELDDGSGYLIIGKTALHSQGDGDRLKQAGASVGPDESAVIVPRDCLLAAARQLAGEDAGDAEARGAYRAYGVITQGLNYRGEPMPEWDDLPVKIRAAWVNAAMGVRNRALMEASDKQREWVTEHLSGCVDGSWDAAHDVIAIIDPRRPESLDG